MIIKHEAMTAQWRVRDTSTMDVSSNPCNEPQLSVNKKCLDDTIA